MARQNSKMYVVLCIIKELTTFEEEKINTALRATHTEQSPDTT